MERFVFTNKARAEVTLKHMNDLIDLYGVASRADMLDLYGLMPGSRDSKFGWTDLSDATIGYEGDEVILCLPKALRLE